MPATEANVAHRDLRFDLVNPRAAGVEFENELDVIRYLVERSDANELVSSILATGWIEFEPLIVERATNVVLEGNRRLAALRLITDADIRDQVGYRLPEINDPIAAPDEIRVLQVDGRDEARAFIAFKHINGPAKWDAMAKAKYSEEWFSAVGNLSKVSKAIGDTHNTVLRLINGWRVYQQARTAGFDFEDITARRFNFSHLYTALSRPSVRQFLRLSEDVASVIPNGPAPDADALIEFMTLLYGQQSAGRSHVVKSQNPDLGRLVRVLGNQAALQHLRTTNNLSAAHEIVEPASHRFAEALALTGVCAERSLGLISHFDSATQGNLLQSIRTIADTVRVLRDEMIKKSTGGEL